MGSADDSAPASRTRARGLVLLAVALPAVLLATGLPSPVPGAEAGGVLKLIPTAADTLRNLALFWPLGIALAWLGVGRAKIAAAAALLSIAIESIQWLVPGRETSPWDVVANTTGAWLGAWLIAQGWSWLQPADARHAQRLHRAATSLATVLLVGGSLLFERSLPEAPYFGHAPPDLPHLEPYAGTVERVEVSGGILRNGALSDSSRLREQLLGDHRVRVDATAAPTTRATAGLALVTNHDQHGVLFVGVRRDALLYAVTTWSHRLGFDGGGRWLPDVIGTATPGTPLRIEIERRGVDLCFGVNAALRCGFGFRLGEGWTHLLPSEIVPSALRPVFDLLWLAGVLALVGSVASGRGRDPVPWATALVGAAAVVWVDATRSPSLAELTALAVGWLAGWAVPRMLRRRSPARLHDTGTVH